MTHLGDRVAALVDGELSHDARDRLLAHVAGCPRCREEVDAARQVKARLARLSVPAPSPALTARLLALAEPGEPIPPRRRPLRRLPRPAAGPRSSPRPQSARPAVGSTGVSTRRGRVAHSSADRLRRFGMTGAGAFSVAGLALGGAFAVGGQSGNTGVPLTPPVDRLEVEHAATTGGVPLTDPAFSSVLGSRLSQPATVANSGVLLRGSVGSVGLTPVQPGWLPTVAPSR